MSENNKSIDNLNLHIKKDKRCLVLYHPNTPRHIRQYTRITFQYRSYCGGDLAKALFPGGVEVAFDADSFKGMISKTKELIDNGTEVIYVQISIWL